MTTTSNYRSRNVRRVQWQNRNVRRVQWQKVKQEERLKEENVSKVFEIGGKLLKRESKPPAGCFALLGCLHRPRYLNLLVKEGDKSGQLTIYKDQCLGEGSFGVIWLGKLKSRNNNGSVKKTKIAVKSISHEKMRNDNHTDDEIVAMIRDEVISLTRCQHTNVIGLHFVIVYKHETLIGMELARNGPLADHFPKISKVTRMQWYTKIMGTIHFCHEKGVMHLDLKPENILLDEDFNVKVADFGISEVVKDVSTLTDDSFVIGNEGGTRSYMAPEMFYGKARNGRKCDIWSLGVILYEILLKRLPFDDDVLKTIKPKVKYMQ